MFQLSLADLGQPLLDTTFVVVDLETTGGSPQRDRITEIGAVKIRGGEVLGELSTLVDPGISIPGSITALTGISAATVAGRPSIDGVLPSFMEFAVGSCLVAHNARFDVGFLNAARVRRGEDALAHPVVCTAQLARRVVGDETRNHRLQSLARHFRATTVPIHRALADARATVDVFHGMLERAGTFGVVTLEDLIAFSRVRNMPVFTARRQLADDLPRTPGVYRFISRSGEVLYVGKATDLRARVRQYFGTDRRPRIAALVKETARIVHTTTSTAVEAEILEAREIRAERPRFNRRGKAVRKPVWVALTDDAFPRLSIVRRRRQGATVLGPLPSRRVADTIIQGLQDAHPIRRCTDRMTADTRFAPCALAELGRCVAPCDGRVDPDGYAVHSAAVARALAGDVQPTLERLEAAMARRAASGRYEEAADCRDRMDALATHVVRATRDEALRAAGMVIASRAEGDGRRARVVIRDGWLVGSTVATAAAAEAQIAVLADGPRPDGVPPPEESMILQRWLALGGVRLEHADAALAWPVAGGRVVAEIGETVRRAKRRAGRADAALAGKRLARA